MDKSYFETQIEELLDDAMDVLKPLEYEQLLDGIEEIIDNRRE